MLKLTLERRDVSRLLIIYYRLDPEGKPSSTRALARVATVCLMFAFIIVCCPGHVRYLAKEVWLWVRPCRPRRPQHQRLG